ncbi:MAG: lipid II flippase MurJ [Chlamydiia bacterium]|nr:lipid II flippase MurJ [Chlamydiia bacterium]MCH9618849.1 lipid II flippase MurJ [Chlamydiia bacterium]MCH9624550.1 lipid II flippase MurJ [Chlamydiia bacterium]
METTDSNESVAKSALHFLTGTFMSRITGLIRDLSMAFCFGVTPAVATFLIAFRLSNLLRRVFGEGALLNGFIPFFEAKRREREENGALFFRDLFWSLGFILLLTVTSVEALLIPLYSLAPLSAAVSDTLLLLIIQLPGLLFICLFGLSMALLQCEKNYFIPGVAPVAFNVIATAAVWYLKDVVPITAMMGLSIAYVCAFVFQWLVTIPTVSRYVFAHISFKQWIAPKLFGKDLKLMITPVLFGIVGVAAVQINSALDILMARFISASGPTLLSYAHRVQQLPIALFAIAISSALLPPLSRAIKKDKFDEYRSLLRYGLTRTYALLFPGTIAIFVLGLSSVNLLYGRGQYSVEAIYATTRCLWAYGLGLIPIAFILLLAPAYYARRDYRTPMIASLIAMGVNITLNLLMIFVFKFSPIAIALSTSASSYVNMLFLMRRLQIDILYKMKSSFICVGISSICAGVVTAAAAYFLYADSSFALLLGDISAPLARDFTAQITKFTSLTFIFGAVFFFFAYLFKAKDALSLVSGIISKASTDK